MAETPDTEAGDGFVTTTAAFSPSPRISSAGRASQRSRSDSAASAAMPPERASTWEAMRTRASRVLDAVVEATELEARHVEGSGSTDRHMRWSQSYRL